MTRNRTPTASAILATQPCSGDPKATHMTQVLVALQRPLRRDDRATAVEYGLMVALIATVVMAAVALIGS